MEDQDLLLPASVAMAGDDAAAFMLSRLPHPCTAAADAAAFVDATTGTSLSFSALRRAALSLASALRLGLGLRRGDAVLVLSRNSLLLPQVLLGVLAAGGVVAAADPDYATPAEVAAAARDSGAVMVVAAPDLAAKLAAVAGLPPLLLTSRSPQDPAALSAEELIDGADPEPPEVAAAAVSDSDVAFLAYPSASAAAAPVAMTHADLVAATARAADGGGGGGRVCVASLPMCSAHGLPLLALGLPAAGVTTVLLPPPSSQSDSDQRAAREAVAAHAATDFVATPEAAAAALAAPVPHDGKLSTLRRVIVAPTPLTPVAREEFRRRLPWVQLTQLLSGTPESQTELLPLPPPPPPPGAAVIQQNSLPADPVSATNEAASLVPPPKKITRIISGDIFSRPTMSKILKKLPITGNRQAASKL